MALEYAAVGSGPPRRKRDRVLLISTMVALLTLPLLVHVSPGGLGRRVEEVDIRSGRIRRYREVLFWRTTPSFHESVISTVLPPMPSSQQEWHIVNTFEGARHVHWAYHGAIADMRTLEQVWQMVPFTSDAKQQVAREVLRLWQSEGDYHQAGRYIQAVAEVGFEAADKPGRVVAAAELPPASRHIAPSSRPGTATPPDGTVSRTPPGCDR